MTPIPFGAAPMPPVVIREPEKFARHMTYTLDGGCYAGALARALGLFADCWQSNLRRAEAVDIFTAGLGVFPTGLHTLAINRNATDAEMRAEFRSICERIFGPSLRYVTWEDQQADAAFMAELDAIVAAANEAPLLTDDDAAAMLEGCLSECVAARHMEGIR